MEGQSDQLEQFQNVDPENPCQRNGDCGTTASLAARPVSFSLPTEEKTFKEDLEAMKQQCIEDLGWSVTEDGEPADIKNFRKAFSTWIMDGLNN